MGRRIGPKTWDRIVEFFGHLGLFVNAQKNQCAACVEIGHLKCMLEMIKAGNGPLDWP